MSRVQVPQANRINQKWLDLPLRVKGLVVLAIPLVALLLSSLSFYLMGQQEDAAERWVIHTAEVKGQIHQTHSMLVEAEARLRGYFLTGQRVLL